MNNPEKRSDLGNLLTLRTLESSTNCPLIRNSKILGSEESLKCGYCEGNKRCNDYKSVHTLREELK